MSKCFAFDLNGTFLDGGNFIHFVQHKNRNGIPILLKIDIATEYSPEGIMFEIITVQN